MDKMITNIVFSKNRPLQLEGYLAGLYKYFPAEKIQTYILYKPELFSEEYEQLFKDYISVRVIRETNFHTDFLSIIAEVKTPYILFGIDDVIYFDKVEISVIEKTFQQFADKLLGFSLRFDKKQMSADFENDNIESAQIDSQEVFAVDWTKGQTKNTRYPFELCATVYQSDDIKRILTGTMNNNPVARKLFAPGSAFAALLSKVISSRNIFKTFGYFFNPNTLESWCCRYTQNNSTKFGNLIAFQNACASAVQVNMVNTSTNNEWDNASQYSVEALNEKYKEGYRIDIDTVHNNPPDETHAEGDFVQLIKR